MNHHLWDFAVIFTAFYAYGFGYMFVFRRELPLGQRLITSATWPKWWFK